MAQYDSGGFQAELLPQEGRRIVAQLMRVPVLRRLPGLKFFIRHSLWPERLLDSIGNGMAIARGGIVLTGLPAGFILDVGAYGIALMQRGLAVDKILLPPLGHRLSRREAIRLGRPQEKRPQKVLGTRAQVNSPGKAVMGRLVLGRAVQPDCISHLYIAGSQYHQFPAAGTGQ